MYVKRKENLLLRYGRVIEEYENQHRFVNEIIDQKLQIFGRKKAEIKQMLKDNGYRTLEEIYPPTKEESMLSQNTTKVEKN